MHVNIEERMSFDCSFNRKRNPGSSNSGVVIDRILEDSDTDMVPVTKKINKKGNCRREYILRILDVKPGNYLIQVKFKNPKQFSSQIKTGKFQLQTKSPRVTWFKLAVRYFFVAISFGMSCTFTFIIWKIPKKFQTVEQQLLVAFGFCLVYFNDPFAIIHTVYPTVLS